MATSILTSTLVTTLISQLQRATDKYGTSTSIIETEIRFREINNATFSRVKEYLVHAVNENYTVTHSKDYIGQDGTRRTATTVPDPTDPQSGHQLISAIHKEHFWSDQLHEWNLKIAISIENRVSIPNTGPVSPGRNKMIRNKHRLSFPLYNGTIRVDLTIVTEEKPNTKPVERFEIEVELEESRIVAEQTWKNLDQVLILLLKLVQNTTVLYTINEKNRLADDINSILETNDKKQKSYVSKKESGRINHNPLVQARNLKLRDLVWGGLLGGNIQYTCTLKASGLRKMFVIHATGIWLVFPPEEYTRLTVRIDQLGDLENTILDGEDLLPEHRKDNSEIKAPHYYLPFDTIASRGSTAIQEQPHMQRLKVCEMIRGLFNRLNMFQNIFVMGEKIFRLIDSTPDAFYRTVQLVDRDILQSPCKTDGYMFTPDNTVYNPHSDYQKLNKRRLTSFPDICKWKDPKDLTMDLRLNWKSVGDHTSNAPGILLANVNGVGRPFVGTDINPFNPETQMDWDSPLLNGWVSGGILELAPDFTHTPIKLFPVRIRHEKPQPNTLEIAQDVWNDINHPLDHLTLEGQTFSLVRAYHNQIKKQLLSEIPNGAYLVDIGSGRGGDVNKWRHLGRILAIEPNLEHVQELHRRLKGTKIGYGPNVTTLDTKVHVEVCGGEDTDGIINAARLAFGFNDSINTKLPPMHITMMLSLSFFWKSIDYLNQLATTIRSLIDLYHRSGGQHKVEFKFVTIEGEAVRELFRNHISPVILGPATITLNNEVVHIDIKDTIVSDQTEYLVKLSDLWLLAGLQPSLIKHATEEKFLSPMEAIYTRLYVYGTAVESGLLSELQVRREKLLLSASASILDASKSSHMPPPKIKRPISPPNILNSNLLRDLARIRVIIPNNEDPMKVGVPVPPYLSLQLDQVQGRRDDDIERWISSDLKFSEFEIYRIATIRECGSFFHCLLKILDTKYSSQSFWYLRAELATRLRRDLAIKLVQSNVLATSSETESNTRELDDFTKRLPSNTYYFTLNHGWFHNRFGSVIKAQEWLISGNEIPIEDLYWVHEILQLNIIILSVSGRKEVLKSSSDQKIWIIFHLCEDGTFEPLGLMDKNSNHLQTRFLLTDHIIRAILS
jgi:hypothetical protein